MTLPIHQVLDALTGAVAEHPAVVLVAPPGAGKTTVVPLALLDAPWRGDGRILVLEPRRLAARAAADRMAATLGEAAGQRVGYRTRSQSRVGPSTRIEVLTEGIFRRMILDDPGLDGVAAVVFDEFHERSLDADLSLALARESQSVLRDDLKLIVMSATLDTQGVARLLGDAPVIRSEGRAHPVETRYLGRDPTERLDMAVARACLEALARDAGSILAFLPGQAEIGRTAERLAERLRDPGVDVVALYGAMERADQDRALSPSPLGRRKIVLATSIAETSLTIEGVRVVIDGGLSRVPRYSPAHGLTRLETVRVSRSSAEQRRGRAGRTEPGVCYRLWDEAETRGLVSHQPPEILNADLTGLVLDLARWGRRSTEGLAMLDHPSAGAWTAARRVLSDLGALDEVGRPTAHGRRLSGLPLSPRLAHLTARAADLGVGDLGARIAAVLSEPGLGGRAVDLAERLRAVQRDRGSKAKEARTLADRWARQARATAVPSDGPADVGSLVAAAYPEWVAKARGKAGEWHLASGRGAWIDPLEPLASASWLAVAELGGGEARDRIRLAAILEPADLEGRMTIEDRLVREPSGRLVTKRRRRVGAIVVDEREIGTPDRAAVTALLTRELDAAGLGAIVWGPASAALRARLAFLHARDPDWPDVSDEALWVDRADWLMPLLETVTRLSDVDDTALEAALRARLGWDRQGPLDRLAPSRLITPLGSAAIDYGAEGGPRVDIRVQELFGVTRHPTVLEGREPLVLALLSPARRPLQLTRDLPGFWAGSWKAVRAEMRGRYPRHPWPEDPSQAPPTARAKPRG